MTFAVDEVHQTYQDYEGSYQALRPLAVHLDRLFKGQFNVSCDISNGYIKMTLPWSKAVLKQVRKTMGRGWKREYDWGGVNNYAYHIYQYTNREFPGARFQVRLYLGQTEEPVQEQGYALACRLVKVGEREVTEPIYEVVCDGI